MMHSPALRARLRLSLVLLAAACALLPGCVLMLLTAGDRDISQDARFAQVLGREIRTRVELRLYAPDNRRPDKLRGICDLEDVRGGKEDLVATLPAGHAVRFDRAVRTRDFAGGSSETLRGVVTVRGRTYPVSYHLGSSVYPEGWRRIYEVFVVRE